MFDDNADDEKLLPPNKRLKNDYNNESLNAEFPMEETYVETSRSSFSRNSSSESMNTMKFSDARKFACLQNLGSTCYINCIIQVMRYSPGFVLSIQRLAKEIDYLKSLNSEMENEIEKNNDTKFVKQLHELLVDMSEKEKADRRPIYTPRKFVNTVWNSLAFWADGSQQDAHEFLQYTIHFINECDLYLKKLHQQHNLNSWEKRGSKLTSDSNLPTTPYTIHKCKSFNSLNSVFDQQQHSETLSERQNTNIKMSNSANYLRTPTKGGATPTVPVKKEDNSKMKKDYFKEELVFKPFIQKEKTPTKVKQNSENGTKICKMQTLDKFLIPQTQNTQAKKNPNKKVIEIKKCFVLLERIDETKLKNGVYSIENMAKVSVIDDQESAKNIRKLRCKSRTFPYTPINTDKNECLDEITLVDNSLPLTSNTSTLTRKRTQRKVKSRAASLNDFIYPLIQSPAELLRKYSTIKGYICEMDKLFKGSSVTLTQCLNCENLRKSPEAFYDRSLPVNTNFNESMDLDWILKSLSNESYLNDDSKYMCDICTSKQEAKIYTEYPEMPNILVLHLLSYGITSSIDGNINTQKINSRSRLDSILTFDCVCNECSNKSKFIKIKHIFKLYAVVQHSGHSLNSGHYTAFINYQTVTDELESQNFQNSKNLQPDLVHNNVLNSEAQSSISTTLSPPKPEWLHFDDTKVKFLTNNEFHRKIIDSSYDSPYILFYVKNKFYL